MKIIRRGARPRRALPVALGLLLAGPLLLLQPSPAGAAPKKAAATASQKASPKTKGAAQKPRARASTRKPAPSATTTPAATPPASTSSAPASAASAAPAAQTQTGPSAAAGTTKPIEATITSPDAPPPPTTVVKTEEERDGEKTYTFGAQEVEGRLKSPQILYFLRRVRAQFDPAPLGHRSFMLELSDTRRHPAFE